IVVRDGMVLDFNEAASRRGIDEGLSLRQARAILNDGKFQPWQREEYEERQRIWLDLCVDFTGVIEPADQHSAWLDLSLHPDSFDIAERVVRTLSQKTGLTVRFGAAPSKWISLLAARHDDGGLAIRDPKAFLAPLPTAELLPVTFEHRERL